ncbi:MAG: hypothetical protein ACLQPH_18685 [Acidimicrobiales bacterium]
MHGSKAPQVQAAARRREEEAHVRTLLERLGNPEPVGHPVEELLGIAAEAKSWLGVLRERLAELPSLESFDRTGAESERAIVSLYERSLDRTGRLLHELARLDLDARLVTIEHQRAMLLLGMVERVLESTTLALDAGQIDHARSLVAGELRALTTQEAV